MATTSTLNRRGLLLALGLAGALVYDAASVRAREDSPARDWALFRGNSFQNGIAGASLPEQLGVRWKFDGKDGFEATAAIVDGVVYCGCLDGNLYAIDLTTGKERWSCHVAPIKAPASVHRGAVYVGDGDGVFHCVDAATGKKRWSFETQGEIVSGANFAGDRVLFGSYDETLYCLAADGKLAWKFKTAGPVNGSPAVVGDRTFVAGCDSSLHVLDTSTGKELLAVSLEGQAGATAAVLGERLYVGTMTNQVLAIEWKKGEILWRFEEAHRQKPFYASAAVTDALVVVGSRDRNVYGLDRKTGAQVWSFTTRGRVDSSPVVVGNRAFVGSLDGNLYELGLADGKELNHFALGGAVAGSPAVAEGCLVIGNNERTLYCFDAKK